MDSDNKSLIDYEKIKNYLSYDENTGIVVWKKTLSNRAISGSRAGCIQKGRKRIYRVIRINKILYLEHRICWLLFFNEWPKDEIDHIDQDPTNNKILNLRVVNTQQNSTNRPIQSNNTSGIRGVSWNKKTNKWISQIETNSINKYLGSFDSIEDAAISYANAKNKLHPFACEFEGNNNHPDLIK